MADINKCVKCQRYLPKHKFWDRRVKETIDRMYNDRSYTLWCVNCKNNRKRQQRISSISNQDDSGDNSSDNSDNASINSENTDGESSSMNDFIVESENEESENDSYYYNSDMDSDSYNYSDSNDSDSDSDSDKDEDNSDDNDNDNDNDDDNDNNGSSSSSGRGRSSDDESEPIVKRRRLVKRCEYDTDSDENRPDEFINLSPDVRELAITVEQFRENCLNILDNYTFRPRLNGWVSNSYPDYMLFII